MFTTDFAYVLVCTTESRCFLNWKQNKQTSEGLPKSSFSNRLSGENSNSNNSTAFCKKNCKSWELVLYMLCSLGKALKNLRPQFIQLWDEIKKKIPIPSISQVYFYHRIVTQYDKTWKLSMNCKTYRYKQGGQPEKVYVNSAVKYKNL